MNEEIWKDIPEYEGLYQISNFGNVRTLMYHGFKRKNPRLLKPQKNSRGYLQVSLCKDNSIIKVFVHRLVAQSFIKNPNNYTIINHKDENPSNNKVDNLEWCDYKYNSNYGTFKERMHNTFINRDDCSIPILQYTLDGSFIKEYPSLSEAARQTGFGLTTIKNCCDGFRKDYKVNKIYKCNQCKGYKFIYKNGN